MTIRRLLASVATIACAAFAMAACGEGEPPGGPASLGNTAQQVTREQEAYIRTMQEAIQAVDNPQTFPLEQAIATANQRQLNDLVLRWDEATRIAAGAKPPEDAAQAHRDLVAAMKQLAQWNRRIAQAAPKGKKATQRVANQARTSPAAKQFAGALDALFQLGYDFSAPDPAAAGGGGDPGMMPEGDPGMMPPAGP